MAAVARPTEDPKTLKRVDRFKASYIGRAPRAIVCFGCARNNEVILGRYDGEKPCGRCNRTPVRRGVVIQGSALPRQRDKT